MTNRPHSRIVLSAAVLSLGMLIPSCATAPSAPNATTPTALPAATATHAPTPTSTPRPIRPPLVEDPLPADVAAKLQAVLDERVRERTDEPSVSAAVVVPGEGIWSGAAGLAATGDQVLATTETAYAIGSVTKTFVAGLTLLLARDGAIALDDPAANWLEGVAADKSNGATIRQLLSHRSGIDEHVDELGQQLAQPHRWTPTELLQLVDEPHFAPGERFEYSNTNYTLLGLIAERAGEAPLEEQLRDRIFEPFGLNRTFLSGREQVTPPLAHGYGRLSELTGDLYDGSGYLPFETLATAAWAGGAIASTPRDVARWLYQLCTGVALGEDYTAQMVAVDPPYDYGLGVELPVIPGIGPAIGHVGQIPGYLALAFYLVDTGTVVVVVTNTDMDPEDLGLVLVELYEIISRA